MSRIALAEMVEQLRDELAVAAKAGKGKEIGFEVGEVVLEAQFEVAREGGGSAGLKFWLVEAGVSGKVTSGSTQTISVKLRPELRGGGSVKLSR